MSYTIELFMWGFQSHFRSAVEFTVERALEELGQPVEPDVFLVGFLREGGKRHPICIEPEDGPVAPADFASTADRAERIFQADPERELWHSDRRLHDARQAALRDQAWRKAIAEVLENKVGGRFFVGPSVHVEEHRVFAAFGLPMAVVDAFPSLSRDHADEERIVLDRSLLEAAVGPLLNHISRALYQPDPGSRLGDLVDAAEVARAAGDALTLDTAYRTDSSRPAHGLFDALNRLSTTTYEKRTGLGRLVVASPAAAGVDRVLMLDEPVPMKETRTLRKLLETSRRDGAALLTNGTVAYGLGDINRAYDPMTESVFEVLVTGAGSWDLRHARQPLMTVTYGSPRLAEPRLSQAQFDNLATRLFATVGGCDVDRLWALATEASQAEHGTMLVISARAADEAHRLQAQALVVQPAPLTAELVRQVTRIDGAVLVDPQGVLFAIGVILDGQATPEGDRARGARFNSAVRYLAAAPRETMIVLVSEDGTLDLLPKLRPRMRQSDLAAMLDELRVVAAIEPVAAERFHRALKRVRAAAFYLSSSQCDEVNQLVDDHWRRRREAGATIWVNERRLSPHPSMSDEYLI